MQLETTIIYWTLTVYCVIGDTKMTQIGFLLGKHEVLLSKPSRAES